MRDELWRARRRQLFHGTILAWLVLSGGLHVAQVAQREQPGEVGWDTRAQLRWLESHPPTALDARVSRMFPEGELFLPEFYGLALLNVAETTGAAEDLARAERVVPGLLAQIDRVLEHQPFRHMAGWRLRGGICWFAGQNLLRARYLQLARHPEPGQVERFHADSAILAEAVRDSQTGVLEAFPGLSWPVDSLLGYASLQVHDRLYGTRYGALFGKWLGSVKRAAEPGTGLAPSFMHLDGRARDVPRGCALSWSGAVLPGLAPAYAAEQWASYRRHFSGCRFGLCLFREYEAGVNHEPDVDSGPIVAGYGMAATAFALAGARASGDVETAEALRRTGELLGMPAVSWWGKRYLGGEVALFDVLALWSRTVPYPAGAQPAPRYLGPALALAALYALLAAWQLRGLRRARARVAEARGRSPLQAALFGVQVALLGLHLAWPAFVGLGLLASWVVLDALGRLAEGLAGLRGRDLPDSLLRADSQT